MFLDPRGLCTAQEAPLLWESRGVRHSASLTGDDDVGVLDRELEKKTLVGSPSCRSSGAREANSASLPPTFSLLLLGNINEARRILKTFEENVSGLAMIRLRRVSLERRHGNMEEAEHLLQEAVKNAKSNYEASFFAVKLARHLFKIQKNLPKARKVLLEAIDRDRVRCFQGPRGVRGFAALQGSAQGQAWQP